MLLTSQSVIQKYWVINSLPLLIWEAPTICERQFVTALVLRFSKQTITSIVPNSAYIWRKKKKKKHTIKQKQWVTPRPLYCKIFQQLKQFLLQRCFFCWWCFFCLFFFLSFFFFLLLFQSARSVGNCTQFSYICGLCI